MDYVMLAVKQLLDNARKTSGSPLADVQRVYLGDPIIIQENVLPAITIQPINSDYVHRGSRYDRKGHQLEVRLVYNAKAYFGSEDPTGITISSASWADGEITFETETPHGLSVGDGVYTTSITPSTYNGTYAVKSVVSSTIIEVELVDDPGTFVSAGLLHAGATDRVFAVMDAIAKVEPTNKAGETLANSICGVIQKNSSLPYDDGTEVFNTVALAIVQRVEYVFEKSGTRPFPSYEAVVTVSVSKIADR